MAHKLLLGIHLSAVFAAIVLGFMNIVRRPKGNRQHRRIGLFYFGSMLIVLFTSLLMLGVFRFLPIVQKLPVASFSGFIDKADPGEILLSILTVFNIYLVYSGYRAANSYDNSVPKIVDRSIWFIGLLTGIILFVIGCVNFEYPTTIICGLHATVIFYFTGTEFLFLRRPGKIAIDYHLRHMLVILTTYLSLVTGLTEASASIILGKEDPYWIIWVFAYVIGLPLIMWWTSIFKQKYAQLVVAN